MKSSINNTLIYKLCNNPFISNNLKNIKFHIFTIVFLCAFHNYSDAQDTTSHFVLNAGGTIFSQSTESGSYTLYPTPELEILYKIHSIKSLSFYTGLNYTYSYSLYNLGGEWKRIAHELALPVFLEQNIGKFISINGGTVFGYLLKGKEEYRSNIPAHPQWIDVTDQTDYNESSRFYIALFFEPKLKYDFDPLNTISVGPTLRYYIEDNWMKRVRNETMIGITLQYSFRF